MDRKSQSGQVMVLVAVSLIALIGSAALILLTGAVEWQRNQLQQIADGAALDSALKIGVGCSAAGATSIITEADNFVAAQRTRTGALSIAAGTCATPYTGTDTFSGGLSETIRYPYRAHQQQVEVILTLTLPISFGATLGATSTTVTRRAVGEQLNGSTQALAATNLSCTGGQVNIAGSVAAQNTIAVSGGCALYAHDRFDAASGTYSDLGDVRVYADGQTWVAGGGRCVAGANSGSSSAVCADGAEETGHVAPGCGTTGTSAFLSAGDQAINPNPCAAGMALPPVPPLATTLPPEPNTDPTAIATLKGTGGAACSASGVFPTIVAGGITWGTGLAPAPTKDAGGYWHFKPSCYGYLNLASTSSGITVRQLGAESARQGHFITASLPAASIAGTLLVATVNTDDTPNKFAAPAGWVAAAEVQTTPTKRAEIWYYPNNPGGISSVTFTVNPATVHGEAQLTEWNGVATASPLDQAGTQSLTVPASTATISTSAATAQSGELVITDTGFFVVGGTYTRGAGWNALTGDVTNGFGSEYRLDLPAGVASETVSTNLPSQWANAIATFKPGAAAAAGAVLDPGFYYFNGSGFAAGGGICLNGGHLLARDVTLEFVNQAGFSSGTCAAGGGASCTAPSCQFGSSPAQPPVDTSFTWFAAPCTLNPSSSPPDASCLGASSWCPSGDRACWNLLIWTPSTGTGQIALKGTAVADWLLGSTYWHGTCTLQVNSSSLIDGSVSCGTASISAAAGAGIAIGSDFGVSTAVVEAILVE